MKYSEGLFNSVMSSDYKDSKEHLHHLVMNNYLEAFFSDLTMEPQSFNYAVCKRVTIEGITYDSGDVVSSEHDHI